MNRIEYQLPNLAVGLINKESVNAAFFSGITAEQVTPRKTLWIYHLVISYHTIIIACKFSLQEIFFLNCNFLLLMDIHR